MALTIDPNYFDLDEQGSSPSTPDTNVVRIYVKDDGKFYRKDDTGVEVEIGNVTEFTTATFLEGSAPSTPASGKVAMYAKTDGFLYSKDDAGLETLVSGGIAGTKLITSGAPSGVSSFTISPIPQTYAHLRLYVYARSTHSSEDFASLVVGNGSVDTTASNYARSGILVAGTTLSGLGDNGAVANLLTSTSVGFATPSNRFASLVVDFIDYRSSFHKVVTYSAKTSLGINVADQKYIVGGGHWLSTFTIDILRLSFANGNFASGSSYQLYGISAS